MNFDTLYETYENRLRGYAKKLTKNSDYAKDLFQETMLVACKKWDIFDYRSEAETRGWLFKIMKNISINTYHRELKIDFLPVGLDYIEELHNRSKPIDTLKYGFVDDYSITETPEKILLNKEIGNKIFRIIENLPDKFCEISKLCFIKERSYKEIAEILNIPTGTVRSRICRSRKIIQNLFNDIKVQLNFKIDKSIEKYRIEYTTDEINGIDIFPNFVQAKRTLLKHMRNEKKNSSERKLYSEIIRNIYHFNKKDMETIR